MLLFFSFDEKKAEMKNMKGNLTCEESKVKVFFQEKSLYFEL